MLVEQFFILCFAFELTIILGEVSVQISDAGLRSPGLSLPLMFAAMSQNRPIDAISLFIVCEPDVLDFRDCFELALQVLGALHVVSSGMHRDISEQLFCFRQITWFSTTFSSKPVPDRPLFFLHLPVSGSSTLMEYLNSYFGIIQLNAEPAQTQQIFIRSFSRFFFVSLRRYVWGNDHMARDCRRVVFSVMLDMTPYAVQTENRHPYQLAAVISHLGNPEKDQGHYMIFLRIFGQWIRFNDTRSRSLRIRQYSIKTSHKQRDTLKPPLSCSMWQTTE
jgi:hypothetical protein